MTGHASGMNVIIGGRMVRMVMMACSPVIRTG